MRRVHYVLSTHWDREWYQTFQDYRYRLVQLLDRVIAGWEREELCGSFQTDGQAIMLEDYLEIRPERREQVMRLVRDGRFKVGPWFVLPDEFLVSGESLLRNLRLGRELARQWGAEPSDAGFMCDMFGHNSQMPQILAGFGIKGALVWRGTNLLENRLFIWKGADGTEMLTYRFGKIGYCTFAIGVRQMDLTAPRASASEIAARLDAFLAEENAQVPAGPMLAFDGCDHAEWDPFAYGVVQDRIDHPIGGYEIVHTTLDDYLDELSSARGEVTQVVEGELREPGLNPGEIDAQWLIPGVGSSRVPLKQYNAACQTLLCAWAEPLSVFAEQATGLPYPTGYLNSAWRWLLMNHPHDSICGCSIDAVHQDMVYRFHQSEGIADRLTKEAARRIAAASSPDLDENSVRVVVFNPLPRALTGEVVRLDLEIPTTWPGWGEMTPFETRPGLVIRGGDGAELAYQRTGQQLNQPRFRVYDTSFPRGYNVHVIKVALPLTIPALGYTTLTLAPGRAGMPTRPLPATGLVAGPRSMANEHLSVTIDTNGTLTLLDKRSGNCYRGLLTFEDIADIGDGWNHGPAANDQAYLSTASHADVALVASGPSLASFRVRVTMSLPAEFDETTGARSERRAEMVVDSLVTLKAGADRVEVETTVHNAVKDHRVRVLFPSKAAAETYLADTPFDVVERPIALRADNDRYREPEIESKPQQNFTAVFDDQRGLAVVAPGQLESAVQDNEERVLALTLFRATRRTVMTAGEPGGQMQGDLQFKYAIVPLNGEPDRAALYDLASLIAAGLRVTHVTPHELSNTRENMALSGLKPQALPPEGSLVSLSGAAVMTSLRRTAAGVEIRCFNPNTAPVQAALTFSPWMNARRAAWVNFESRALGEPFAVENSSCSFELGPKQIRTLCLLD